MNRWLILLLLVVVFSGCDEKRPSDILPESKMRSVLYDLLRADELGAQYLLHDSAWSTMEKRAPLYQKVFLTHQVSKEQFQRTLVYYEERPDEMKKMIETLSADVEALQRKGDTTVTGPARERDTSRKKIRPAVAQ